jgi:hypothetical protein
MAKDDAPAPAHPPAKRRQLEKVPDLWVAQWLAGDTITPSERRRLEELKASRKARRDMLDVPVGLIIGHEGMTPEQLDALPAALAGATSVQHRGLPSRYHQACRRVAPVTIHRDDDKAVVRASKRVVAMVRSRTPEGTDVWETVRYAKHRGVAVRVVLPDGQLDDGQLEGAVNV